MEPNNLSKEVRQEIQDMVIRSIGSGMSAWESIDYESHLTTKAIEENILNKDEQKELNAKVPFIYVAGSLKKEAPKYYTVISVGKNKFKTEHLSIQIPQDWEKRVFRDTSEFDHQYKLKVAKEYKAKYPALKEKAEKFEKFADENPDYII